MFAFKKRFLIFIHVSYNLLKPIFVWYSYFIVLFLMNSSMSLNYIYSLISIIFGIGNVVRLFLPLEKLHRSCTKEVPCYGERLAKLTCNV